MLRFRLEILLQDLLLPRVLFLEVLLQDLLLPRVFFLDILFQDLLPPRVLFLELHWLLEFNRLLHFHSSGFVSRIDFHI